MPSENDIILANLLELNTTIAAHPDRQSVIEKVMTVAARVASADGGFFFEISSEKYMSLTYSSIKSLREESTGFDNFVLFEPESLNNIRAKEKRQPAEICALNNEVVIVENLYADPTIDNSRFAAFDEQYNYATVSVLALPLTNSKGNLIGVAQFTNAADSNGKVINFTKDIVNTLTSFCSLLSLVLENKSLREAYSQLLESFIEVLARAIDAKSPYTGSHCQKVPIITRLLATAAVEEDQGPLKNFEMSADDWYTLHIASWLHDCGKVTTPEYIVDKATKLETVNNRIHEIRNRFEIMRRDAHIAYLQKRLANLDSKENLQAEFVAKVKQLEDDFSFIAWCNTGDNEINEADISRLEKIAKQTYTRHFNRMIGLSWAERNMVTTPELYSHPAQEPVLQDLPDHLIDGFNRGELHNLKIHHGTITKEERAKINDHINVTIDMLKALPFPKELSNVVEYAGCHHEWVNGKGYPNHLTGSQMSVPAKIMAIADVFEALTARDRPYKEPKKLSEVLRIMQEMKNIGHLDPDLYRVFITHKVYLDYAEQYIEKEQIDEINPEEYL